jgi:hypothetical protein
LKTTGEKDDKKMMESKKFYDDYMNGPQFQEHMHIHKHVIKNMQGVKTLDVKIMELKEKADDVELLVSIMAMVFQ